MPDQTEIHEKSISKKNKDRRDAIKLLVTHFSSLPDKDQAWQDLHKLTQDEGTEVRLLAALALGAAFSQVPDKDLAWQDLHRLTQDQNSYVRSNAVGALVEAFSQVPNNDQVWQDLHRLTQDEDAEVRLNAADALVEAFSQVTDKDQVWQDLHKLTQDERTEVRLHAALALGAAFSQVPDKDLAWQDLHRLTQDLCNEVRMTFAIALMDLFSQVPDKDLAWQDLVSLTQDQDKDVRFSALNTLLVVFSQAPAKDIVWPDLHRLIQDEYREVRLLAVYVLELTFSQVSDKDLAWQDLHRLTQDQDKDVRSNVASALGAAFSQVPDKDLAWQDLHRLTQDQDKDVRSNVASALGAAFSQVPDKDLAWQDLQRLTQDQDKDVRSNAYHSLGRASVSKSTEAHDKDTLKKDLEVAVAFFEKSSQESDHSPASFCYPFYRSYLAITFQDAKENEIQRYLAEAKEAIGGSDSKDELFKAVENLSEALQESKRLKDKPFRECISELNTYRLYCEKAAEYMAAAEDKAPGAVKLMRRCNPLLEDRIKATIAEIQEKARLISPEVDKAARCLSLGDPIKVHQCCMRIASVLRDSCNQLPDEKRELTCGILTDIEKEEELSAVLGKIELAMKYTLPEIEAERREMLDRLKNIEFGMAKLNLSSGSARHDLFELKTIIKNFQDKTEACGLSMEELNKVLKERDDTLIGRLQNMKEDWLLSVEEMAQSLPSCDENERILKEIQSLKQSRKRDALGITGDISSIAGLLVGLIGLAVTMKPA